jgi:hypothetical protein
MINFSAFLRPMPRPADAPGPLDETGIIDSAFEGMNRRSQQGKENARADERLGIDKQHEMLANKREQDYIDLAKHQQGYRERTDRRETADKQRALIRELMDKYVNAPNQASRAMYRQQLAQLGINMDRERGTPPPAISAPMGSRAQTGGQAPGATRDTTDYSAVAQGMGMTKPAPAAAPDQLSPEAAQAVGGMMGGGNRPTSAPMSAQETRQLSGMANRPMLPHAGPASSGIIPQRPMPAMAARTPDAGGPAPNGGGPVGPIPGQGDLEGDWQQAYARGGGPPLLPGQTPVLTPPPEWLRQYMDAERMPEQSFLSEGDSLQ